MEHEISAMAIQIALNGQQSGALTKWVSGGITVVFTAIVTAIASYFTMKPPS